MHIHPFSALKMHFLEVFSYQNRLELWIFDKKYGRFLFNLLYRKRQDLTRCEKKLIFLRKRRIMVCENEPYRRLLKMKIILASNSPRRKEILEKFGIDFITIKSDYEEKDVYPAPIDTVKAYALGKAENVFNGLGMPKDTVVLGADTVVCIDNEIIGKPSDKADAIFTLKKLSGRTHAVITGYCLISRNKSIVDAATSHVTFNKLTDEDIEDYVNKFKPFDKAGSYGVQDDFPLIKEIRGSYYNVMGLPIEDVKEALKSF